MWPSCPQKLAICSLYKLVQKSYDINAEFTEGDSFFIEKVIDQEENAQLKKAFEDLNGFMFGW